MTVQEAKEVLNNIWDFTDAQDEEKGDIVDDAIIEAIGSIEEVEQYRALGTVEELKEAREKQIPQSPTLEGDGYCPEGNLVYDTWICPNCDKDYEVDYDDYDYCPNCGQKINREIFY